MNELTLNALYESDELYHYGVIGMKWGVRRYQPYGEGGYDPEHKGKFVGSKREFKKEFKKDNRRLKKAVKDASVLGYAHSKSNYLANKYDKKRLEKPSEHNDRKAAIERRTAATLENAYKEAEQKAQNLVKEMREKYGNDVVRDIVYKEDKMGNKVVNEKIASGGEYAASLLASAAGYAMAVAMGVPVAMIVVPADRTSSGNKAYSVAKANAKSVQKQIDKRGPQPQS